MRGDILRIFEYCGGDVPPLPVFDIMTACGPSNAAYYRLPVTNMGRSIDAIYAGDAGDHFLNDQYISPKF